MTWLGGWLRELILVVLMAAFVEMLLPSKSMERYARLVLSLLVLLTMLSPIISLLKGDAASELSMAMVQQEKEGGILAGARDGKDSLEKILADGRMLAAGVKEQSLQLAAGEVARQMRDQIAGGTGVQGAKVTVTLGTEKAPGTGAGDEVPAITSVTVFLPAADAAPGKGSSDEDEANNINTPDEPIVIRPVQPVQVHLGEGGRGDANGEGTETALSGEERPAVEGAVQEEEAKARTESIIRLLVQNWSLDREAIRVLGGDRDAEKL